MNIKTWQDRFDANEHPHYTEYDAMNAEIDELRSEVKRLEAACNKFSEAELLQAQPVQEPAPIDMVLHCPRCHTQHVDAPDERTPDWKNPPHKSHLCHACGCIWRPADVPTNGVAETKSKGSNDSPPVAQPVQEPVAYETYAIKFANGRQLTYTKPENLPDFLGVRPLYALAAQPVQSPPLSMSMFASKADYEAALKGKP